MSISFSEPFVSGREMEYIAKVFENGHFQGNGEFTKGHMNFWSSRLVILRFCSLIAVQALLRCHLCFWGLVQETR